MGHTESAETTASWKAVIQEAFRPTCILDAPGASGDRAGSEIQHEATKRLQNFQLTKVSIASCSTCSGALPSLQSLLRKANLSPSQRVKEASSHGRVLRCDVGNKSRHEVVLKVMPLVRDDVWLSLFESTGEKQKEAIERAHSAIRDPHNSAYLEPAVLACLSRFVETDACAYFPRFYGAALACADRRDKMYVKRKDAQKTSNALVTCASRSTPVVVCIAEALAPRDAHTLIRGSRWAEEQGGRPLHFIPFLGHILAALDQCHEADIVHNDIHFSNVLVRRTKTAADQYRTTNHGIVLRLPNPSHTQLVVIDFGRAAEANGSYVMSEIRRFKPKWDVTRKHADVSMVLASLLRHWPALSKSPDTAAWPSSWDSDAEVALAKFVQQSVNCRSPQSSGVSDDITSCFSAASQDGEFTHCEHKLAHTLRGKAVCCEALTASRVLESDVFVRYRSQAAGNKDTSCNEKS